MRYDSIPDFDMNNDSYSSMQKSSSSGMLWLWIPLLIILVGGTALSIAAYMTNELTIVESIIAGFVGLTGLFVGLIAGFFGLIIGLLGALLGVVTAGGAIAITLFVIASPILALILLFLLLRRSKECPDPSAHGEYDV